MLVPIHQRREIHRVAVHVVRRPRSLPKDDKPLCTFKSAERVDHAGSACIGNRSLDDASRARDCTSSAGHTFWWRSSDGFQRSADSVVETTAIEEDDASRARSDLGPDNDDNAKDWRSVLCGNQLAEREALRGCAGPLPVVHLELHTRDLPAARDFYLRLLNWRPERVDTEHGHYTALNLGGEIGGGVVQCGTDRPLWIPYVQVDRIDLATDHARTLGGSVLLEPREGSAGWRSVVAAPGCAELALWQPKEWT